MPRTTFRSRVNPKIRQLSDLFDLDRTTMEPMADDIDKEFRKNMARLFATEGRSGGKRWKRLSKRYAERKARARPGRKILVYDREMRDSLATAGHPLHVKEFGTGSDAYVEVGTNDPKARWHADGAGRLPVRPPIQHTRGQLGEYNRIARDHLNRKIRRVAVALRFF